MMIRKTIYLFSILLSSLAFTQNTLLLEKNAVSVSVSNPDFERLTNEAAGKRSWNPAYVHLDSVEIYDITYLSDGLKVKGFITGPKKNGTFPAIIFNRGGNREFGAITPLRCAFIMGKLAANGYVVIASQYRGNGGSEGQEEFGGIEVNDVLILSEVLKEIPKADADNIGMYGWSRGGMMTYQALTKADWIKAAVVGGAVSDQFASIADRPAMETRVLAEVVPDYQENKEQELIKRSAVRWVDKFPKNVPLLILHGNSDWRVKPEQSLMLALELEKHRVPYRLMIFEGGDHGIREHRPEVDAQILRWFDRFLKQKGPLPDMEYHGR